VASEVSKVDAHLRLKMADLDPIQFEKFFHDFFATRPELTVLHHGRRWKQRVATASAYAAGSGRKDRGVDVRLEMEGGEIWAVQCKQVKKWKVLDTREAIAATHEFGAKHYILAVACDVGVDVHDEIAKHGAWTLWNLDTICTEFRQRVPVSLQLQCLPFLSPAELAQFLPYATDALISPERFFKGRIGAGSGFRHDWKLVGRQKTLGGLMDFVAAEEPDKPRALLLTARGGEGKSRLLLELSRRLEQEPAGRFEVVFLNPASTDNRPERGLVTEASRLVVLVDDAHRVENLPRWLLEWVRQDPKARVILAARPQGREAVRGALQDAGVDPADPELVLEPLTGGQARELATEVLGQGAADRVPWLLERTKDSPFLTVVAGRLLRDGRIEAPADISDEAFRRLALHAFEASNIQAIPEPDRERFRALLRLIAVLSPVERSAEFAGKVARCLEWNTFDVDTALDRLGTIELVVGERNQRRVVPDLFADFLVYDLCYGAGEANRRLMDRVLAEFAECGPVILRNLAEAAWLARRDGKEDPKFMGRLLEAERARFEKAGFGERADILRHWVRFSVFLTREALDLARQALELTTAPDDPDAESEAWFGGSPPNHATVLRQLPALLEPIAEHHPDHQSEALDFLWRLGFVVDWKDCSEGRKQAWAAIANILRFRKRKAPAVTIRALEWLAQKLNSSEFIHVLEKPDAILLTLLSPCFARTVETNEFTDSAVTFTQWAIDISRTQPVRDLAIAILSQTVRSGTWLAALDAISAAQVGFQGTLRGLGENGEERDAAREQWRPERIKALRVIREAIQRHSHVALRVRVRMEMRQLAAWDEDPAVCDEARRIEGEVVEDLDLALASAVLNRVSLTIEELQMSRAHDEGASKAMEAKKQGRLQVLVQDIVRFYARPECFREALERLLADLIQVGEWPETHELYSALSQGEPVYAAELGRQLIANSNAGPLAHAWTQLVDGNVSLAPDEQKGLMEAAARGSDSQIRSELTRSLSWRFRRADAEFSDGGRRIVELLVQGADANLALELIRFVRWAPSKHRGWAWTLVPRLPLAQLARGRLDALVELLDERGDAGGGPPVGMVAHILSQFVHAQKLDFSRNAKAWGRILEAHARAVFDLIVARIERSSVSDLGDGYEAIPQGWRSNFILPGLQADSDYPKISADLWKRVTAPGQPQRHEWRKLFQAVVVGGAGDWTDELRRRVECCESVEALGMLTELLRFSGSLVIFRTPTLARAILVRAEQLGGSREVGEFTVRLYATAGPGGKSYTNGRLDPHDDYVEAEAIRAAETHADDPVLGPFYRWIVQVEEEQRNRFEADHRAAMAALDRDGGSSD
jgi:hypothetical protein